MATPRVHGHGHTVHVLVVDDEPAQLDVARERLEGERHRVTTLGRAKNLRAVIRALDPDLVLVDVLMPDLSAGELTRLLDAQGTEGAPSIILHSSIPLRALRQAVDASKALGVLQKTKDDVEFFFAFNELLDRLRQNESRGSVRECPPAVSGTHRIADEESPTLVDFMDPWFSRTSPGQR